MSLSDGVVDAGSDENPHAYIELIMADKAAAPSRATMHSDPKPFAPPVLPDGLGCACPICGPLLAAALPVVEPVIEPVVEGFLVDAPVGLVVAAVPVD